MSVPQHILVQISIPKCQWQGNVMRKTIRTWHIRAIK